MRRETATAGGTARRGLVPRGGLSWAMTMVVAAATLVVLIATALTVAGYVLPVAAPRGRVDALVVLGGFGVPRASLAAHLYGERASPLVVVSGAGDCDAMRDTLLGDGVPADAVATECASRSTFQNARNTVEILRGRGVRSAELVTHWFHARRAIAAFHSAAPEIAFSAASVRPAGTPRWRLGWATEPGPVIAEYAKIAWYALAYGIFVGRAPEPAKAGTSA